jgi:hypothetical protein
MTQKGFERFFLNHISIIGALVAAVLLVVYMVAPSPPRIDAITIALLVLILLSPYLSLIKRIRIGEFEAEIDRAQIDKLENAVRSVEPDEKVGLLRPSALEDQLLQLAETDPALALARLRIEIEQRLRSLADISSKSLQQKKVMSRLGIRQLSRILLKEETLDRKAFEAIEEIIDVLNKAVHGIKIESNEAIRVVDTGLTLLHYLDNLIGTIAEPKETQKITPEEESESRERIYRVTTVVPYVSQPERRTYVFTQEQLDAFLGGYDEYAEYVVRVEEEPTHAETKSRSKSQ